MNEPYISIKGNNIVAGSNYRYSDGSVIRNRILFSVSIDLGINWTNSFMGNTTAQSGTWDHDRDVDPCVILGENDEVYCTYLSLFVDNSLPSKRYDNLLFFKSTDLGQTWEPEKIIEHVETWTGETVKKLDKPMMCMDKNSNSIYQNTIYVSYFKFDSGAKGVYLDYKRPNSSDFQTSDVLIESSTNYDDSFAGPFPLVAGNGVPIIAYLKKESNNYSIKVSRSNDGGENFQTPITVSQTVPIGEFMQDGYYLGSSSKKVKVNNMPSGTVTANNNVFLVWNDNQLGNPDIFIAKSTNDGQNWTVGKTNIINYGDEIEFMPWITATDDGKLYLLFYQMLNNDMGYINVKMAVSTDNGTTFTMLPSVFEYYIYSNNILDDGEIKTFIGDYITISSNNSKVAVAYTANNQAG